MALSSETLRPQRYECIPAHNEYRREAAIMNAEERRELEELSRKSEPQKVVSQPITSLNSY